MAGGIQGYADAARLYRIPMVCAVGYAMFPLTQAGISGQLQDVMHLVVTVAVVLLSIASLTLIADGACGSKPALRWADGRWPRCAS